MGNHLFECGNFWGYGEMAVYGEIIFEGRVMGTFNWQPLNLISRLNRHCKIQNYISGLAQKIMCQMYFFVCSLCMTQVNEQGKTCAPVHNPLVKSSNAYRRLIAIIMGL